MPFRTPLRSAEIAPLQTWILQGNTVLILAALDDTPDWMPLTGDEFSTNLAALTGMQFRTRARRVARRRRATRAETRRSGAAGDAGAERGRDAARRRHAVRFREAADRGANRDRARARDRASAARGRGVAARLLRRPERAVARPLSRRVPARAAARVRDVERARRDVAAAARPRARSSSRRAARCSRIATSAKATRAASSPI